VLTPADDFLIHQTPRTFDYVFTSDRNFYDRYFFNGYQRDGEVYFAVAMGAYPNMGVFDAAFSVVYNGKQKNVRASRLLGHDRMAAEAGPIKVEVLEPLKKIRVTVAPNDYGITANLVFDARSFPFEEPHFFREIGNLVAMDYTRMTQHGAWTGTISFDGRTFEVTPNNWWGSRDHSWGIRNVGGRDPRGAPPQVIPQFYWNWAPLNFEDLCTLYTVSEYADGSRWHQSGVAFTPYPNATETPCDVGYNLKFQSGTRWIADGSTITMTPKSGAEPLEIRFQPLYQFLMQGIGYGHPKWGHGMWVGPNEVAGDEYTTAAESAIQHLHVQTVSKVTTGNREGIGIFEIIVMGPHVPSGFKDLMDPAP